MQLYTIDTGFFKLDGGAMFGVVPKSIWNKLNPSDENNMCNWAMRCLLVEDGNRLILIDTGMGNKQSEKFFSFYYLSGNATLVNSIKSFGFTPDDITDVFLTHLHFDHCGGAVEYDDKKELLKPVFKNATYWSNSKHWNWAVYPNAREKASFLKENIMPLQESGQLKFLEEGESLTENFDIIHVHGHTEAMMLPVLHFKGYKIVYCADLIPSAAHIPIPYVMGYDVRPLLTLSEKEKVLNDLLSNNGLLYFEHDAKTELCNLEQTERGIRLKEELSLAEI